MSKIKLDSNSVVNSFRSLESGLKTLTLLDNMKGFYWEGSIVAGAEVEIRNKFREGVVPTGFIITMISPVSTLVKGPTEWSKNFVYLKNCDATNTITVGVFFIADRDAAE
jgi:hypothetical protein